MADGVLHLTEREARFATRLGGTIIEGAESEGVSAGLLCVILARVAGAVLSAAQVDGRARTKVLQTMIDEARAVGRDGDAIRDRLPALLMGEAGNA